MSERASPDESADGPSGRFHRMRRRFGYFVTGMGGVASVAFALLNHSRGATALMWADITLAMMLFINLALVGRARTLQLPTLVSVGALVFFLVVAASKGYLQPFFWLYAIPGSTLFVVGLRLGSLLTALSAAVVLFALFYWPPTHPATGLEPSIIASFTFVAALTFLYERTRLDYERELRRLSTTDHLTGIANRRQFDLTLQAELLRAERYQRPLSLVVFDVDHFKQINDRLGHGQGDVVLRELAERVRSEMRSSDLFARLGGDEFAVLLPETPAGNAEGGAFFLAERLRAAVASHAFSVSSGVSISLGLAGVREGDSPSALVHRADEALYQAKRNGRNQVAAA